MQNLIAAATVRKGNCLAHSAQEQIVGNTAEFVGLSSAIVPAGDGSIDPRRIFLLKVAILHELVKHNEWDLGEAFDTLIESILWFVFPLPESEAEGYWGSPGWRQAAIEYQKQRGNEVLIVKHRNR